MLCLVTIYINQLESVKVQSWQTRSSPTQSKEPRSASPDASVFVARKRTVEGLTKSDALEGAAGVRVNAVVPDPVTTEILDHFVGGEEGKAGFLATIRARRPPTPEEIAQTIVFLASDKSYRTVHCSRRRLHRAIERRSTPFITLFFNPGEPA